MKIRKCNQCGNEYDVRQQGKGGGSAHPGDLENFPFDGHTGVRAVRPHWMNGAHCSDRCYAAAYYEPPFPYGP